MVFALTRRERVVAKILRCTDTYRVGVVPTLLPCTPKGKSEVIVIRSVCLSVHITQKLNIQSESLLTWGLPVAQSSLKIIQIWIYT